MLLILLMVMTTVQAKSFFPNRPSKVPIFHRPSNVFNGHAKPKNQSASVTLLSPPQLVTKDDFTGEQSLILTRPPPVTSKYFVTWRPDLQENNVIITLRSSNKYKPQHYFSQIALKDKKPSSSSTTIAPFLVETSVSLDKPVQTTPSTTTPTAWPASTTSSSSTPSSTWSYTPVFNPIFSTISSTTTATGSYEDEEMSNDKITVEPELTNNQTFGTKIYWSHEHDDGGDDDITNQSSSNLSPLEDYDTIFQSPQTFLAYIQYVLSTFFRSDLQNNI